MVAVKLETIDACGGEVIKDSAESNAQQQEMISAVPVEETQVGKDDVQVSYNQKFPSELREEMMARVGSVTHLCRMRLVCKAWNSAILSPDLAQLHAARCGNKQPPWLLVARSAHTRRPLRVDGVPSQKSPQIHLICDPCTTMQQWITPRLPFLTAHSCDLSTCHSHRGLVCCLASTNPNCRSYGSRRSNTVLIFNPITGAYKLLPSPPIRYAASWRAAHSARNLVRVYDEEELLSHLDVALWRSSESRGHVRVAVCNRATRLVCVFDSRKGYWKEGSRAPDRLNARFQGFRDSQKKETLYWYDVEMDSWRQTRLPAEGVGDGRAAGGSAGCTLKWPSIFKDSENNLKLAAVLVQGGSGGSVAVFGVWEWRSGGGGGGGGDGGGDGAGEWAEVAITPGNMVRGLLHRLRDSKLMCHPKYVCMTSLLRFSPYPWKCFYPWMLSFSAPSPRQQQQQQTWKWSPHPMGPKTWANFHVISLLDPTLLCIP